MLLAQVTRAVKYHSLSSLMTRLVGITLCFYVVSTNALELGDIAQDDNDGGFVINGVDTGDQMGYSVSNIGDINGDGLADFFVGASHADYAGNADVGKSYVIFGKSDGSGINLSTIEAGEGGGFVILNDDVAPASSYAGFSVSGAGDVNGDNIPDLIIGAPYATANGVTNAGKSYVIWGGTNDTTPIKLSDVAAGVNGFVINGITQNSYSGRTVSDAKDVNNDGLDDMIIGSVVHGASGRAAYVIFGKKNGIAVELSDIANGIGGFVIEGLGGGSSNGITASGAGYVNNDDYADLIIGSFLISASYVVFGKSDSTSVNLSTFAINSTNGFIIKGIDASDRTGLSVSNAGDVNQDGLDDVVIGAPYTNLRGNSDAGSAYVVFGKNDTSPVELSEIALTHGGGFVMHGVDADNHAGLSVSGAGDVNGDGLHDILIGAHSASSNSNGEGSVAYLVLGKADSNIVELSAVALGNNGFVMNGIGEKNWSWSGSNVSNAGDVNGDGWDDLLIGAHGANALTGQAYVVFSPFASDETPIDPTQVNCSATHFPAIYNFSNNTAVVSAMDMPDLDSLTGLPTGRITTFSAILQKVPGVDNFQILADSLVFVSFASEYSPYHARYTYSNNMFIKGGVLELCISVPSVVIIPPGTPIPTGAPPQLYYVKLNQLVLEPDIFHIEQIELITP